MASLHENQQKILDFLLGSSKGATLVELSAHLGITKTAVKEHVIKLDTLGYIGFEDINQGVGRPKRFYKLSKKGQEVFPKQYAWLSNILLELLSEKMGSEAIEVLMKELAGKVTESLSEKIKNQNDTQSRIKILADIMNELGYRAILKQSDIRKGAIIEASNCVYHSLAQAHPELCQFDIKLIENISSMNVKLESCIARGGSVCRFCIKK